MLTGAANQWFNVAALLTFFDQGCEFYSLGTCAEDDQGAKGWGRHFRVLVRGLGANCVNSRGTYPHNAANPSQKWSVGLWRNRCEGYT